MISVTSAILLAFAILTWFIMNYLTRPISQIIEAVKPYQEGETKVIPGIHIDLQKRKDEFGQLAHTLNDMSVKIQQHINSLIEERNDKKMVLDSWSKG